jgi:hypothetical protein
MNFEEGTEGTALRADVSPHNISPGIGRVVGLLQKLEHNIAKDCVLAAFPEADKILYRLDPKGFRKSRDEDPEAKENFSFPRIEGRDPREVEYRMLGVLVAADDHINVMERALDAISRLPMEFADVAIEVALPIMKRREEWIKARALILEEFKEIEGTYLIQRGDGRKRNLEKGNGVTNHLVYPDLKMVRQNIEEMLLDNAIGRAARSAHENVKPVVSALSNGDEKNSFAMRVPRSFAMEFDNYARQSGLSRARLYVLCFDVYCKRQSAEGRNGAEAELTGTVNGKGAVPEADTDKNIMFPLWITPRFEARFKAYARKHEMSNSALLKRCFDSYREERHERKIAVK